jgi:hypothetical protein
MLDLTAFEQRIAKLERNAPRRTADNPGYTEHQSNHGLEA